MTALRDIRLWLIIALAVLCLIALRTCTIDYSNTSDNIATVDGQSSTDNADVASVESDAEKSAEQNAEAEQAGDSVAAEVADNAAGATERTNTEVNKLVSEGDASQDEKNEASAAVSDATTTSDGSGTESSDQTESASAATTESDGSQENAEAGTGSTDAGADAEASDSQTSDSQTPSAAVSEADDAGQANATADTATNIEVIKRELVEFKLGELSNTGNFGEDLTADIATVREGLGDYDGRIESLKAFVEQFRADK